MTRKPKGELVFEVPEFKTPPTSPPYHYYILFRNGYCQIYRTPKNWKKDWRKDLEEIMTPEEKKMEEEEEKRLSEIPFDNFPEECFHCQDFRKTSCFVFEKCEDISYCPQWQIKVEQMKVLRAKQKEQEDKRIAEEYESNLMKSEEGK